MVILTAKLSKSKRIIIVVLLILAIVVLALCVRGAGKSDEPATGTEAQTNRSAKTEEERIAYLSGFGWEVEPEPVQTQEVRVPTEPNDVFLRYNDLQKSQGFDLSEYAGKSVRRYVYKVTNYPGSEDETWYATLLVYKDEVIGGDVSSSAQNGIMHGLSKPDHS